MVWEGKERLRDKIAVFLALRRGWRAGTGIKLQFFSLLEGAGEGEGAQVSLRPGRVCCPVTVTRGELFSSLAVLEVG